MNGRVLIALTAVLGAVLVMAGCSANTGGPTAPNTVVLKDISFNPDSLTVNSGQAVTIKNEDSVGHRIVVGSDDLGLQAPGETKKWTPPRDGTYPMKCLIHPSMQGTIVVGSASGGGSAGDSSTTTGTGGGTGSSGTSGGGGSGTGGGSGISSSTGY